MSSWPSPHCGSRDLHVKPFVPTVFPGTLVSLTAVDTEMGAPPESGKAGPLRRSGVPFPELGDPPNSKFKVAWDGEAQAEEGSSDRSPSSCLGGWVTDASHIIKSSNEEVSPVHWGGPGPYI